MKKKNTAKKAKNTFIIILIAAILGTASFFIGLAIMRANLETESKNPAENQSVESSPKKKKKTKDEKAEDKSETKPSEPQSETADEQEGGANEESDADTEKTEGTAEDESNQEGVVLPDDESPSEPEKVYPSEYEDYSSESDDWYRVKTAPGDNATQKGAFRTFESAKSLADAHKSDGYKVYDKDMRCIYIP